MFLSTVKSGLKEDISILVQLDNHSESYLCDCGEASGFSIKEYQNIAVVFISHTHIDHFIDFDQLLRHQLGTQKRITICGPQGIAKQVSAKINGYTWNLVEESEVIYEIREIVSENHIDVYELNPPVWKLIKIGQLQSNIIYANERFEVQFTALDHKIPSIAYLFTEEDSVKINLEDKVLYPPGPWINQLKQAFVSDDVERVVTVGEQDYLAKDLYHLLSIKKGDTLGVIMDHDASEENHAKIKALFTAKNKVYIEAFYKNEHQDLAAKNKHSYAAASAQIMRKCQVKEAIPVHFSRKYKIHEIRELVQEFEEVYHTK